MLITREESRTVDIQDLTREDVVSIIREAYEQAGLPPTQDFRPMDDQEPTAAYLTALRDWSIGTPPREYSPRSMVWPYLVALLFERAEGYGRVTETEESYAYEVGGGWIDTDGKWHDA
jgi:hypothetical protein